MKLEISERLKKMCTWDAEFHMWRVSGASFGEGSLLHAALEQMAQEPLEELPRILVRIQQPQHTFVVRRLAVVGVCTFQSEYALEALTAVGTWRLTHEQ